MDSALAILIQYGYVVVFGAVFAEQIGLPFPSEPVLIAAGALIGTGRLIALLLVLAGGHRLADRRHRLVLDRAGRADRACWAGCAASRWSPLVRAPSERPSPTTARARC